MDSVVAARNSSLFSNANSRTPQLDMARFTELDGVTFTEATLDLASLGDVIVRARSQNSSLSELKREMAKEAKSLGGNCIMNFRYSQKADSPLKNVFSFKWDTERLVGTGDVVSLPEDFERS